MLSLISIKKMVQGHLYVIAFSFIVLAILSLRISDISRSNFQDITSLQSRVTLLDQAMYKLMMMRGDILYLKTASLSQQQASDAWADAINANNTDIRRNIGQWVKEKKSNSQTQELSEKAGALFTQVSDNYMEFFHNIHGSAEIIDKTDDLITELETVTGAYYAQAGKMTVEFQERADFLHDVLWITLAVVTQQNAALVEESAAITVMMDERTGELESMVAVFHIEKEAHEA